MKLTITTPKLFGKLKNMGYIPLTTKTTTLQIFKEVFIGALLLQLFLEVLSHRSFAQGLLTTVNNPLMFICSVFLLSSFLSLSLLLPKRHFGYLIVSSLWLWLGFTNFLLLSFRTTPLTATDFKMLSSVFTVIERYLNNFQMSLFLIFASFVVLSILFIGTKLPYTKIKLRLALITVSLSILLLVSSFNVAIKANAVSNNVGNIAEAFLDYGFAYSFSTSVVDIGIQEPKSYSSEKIGAVLETLAMENTSDLIDRYSVSTTTDEATTNLPSIAPQVVEPNTAPNIIVIQLESFFDVKRLKSLDYNQDPTPNITYLQQRFSSGFVTVPSIGAGTVNTEFEILSGMSLDYFGAGEYPYKTILKKSTVESLPYDLSELGYQSHALHNNMGTFYSRNSVYPNLGFNTFTSIEYMDNVTYNPIGWAEDITLVPEIMKALNSTTTQDFVYAVSVQPHGQYPDTKVLEDPVITPIVVENMPQMINNDQAIDSSYDESSDDALRIANDKLLTNNADLTTAPLLKSNSSELNTPNSDSISDIDEATYNKYLYFVNQIYETDAFVGKLIRTLEDYPEPLVVVFYGDHLPSFDIAADDLKEGTPYQMDYVIWDNMGLNKIDEDLSAYQMSSMITERLGINTGLLNRFHQTMKDSPDYQDELQLLQYDMLYGDRNVYSGINPYKKTKMTMGIDPISITDVYLRGEGLFISGKHFTPFSEVYIDKEKVNTLFIDGQTLIVPNLTLKDGMAIKVSQVTETGKKLSSTDTWNIYNAKTYK
jgi:phosphoglycerol transferase MdoB-like AlkP superfamily enzyme